MNVRWIIEKILTCASKFWDFSSEKKKHKTRTFLSIRSLHGLGFEAATFGRNQITPLNFFSWRETKGLFAPTGAAAPRAAVVADVAVVAAVVAAAVVAAVAVSDSQGVQGGPNRLLINQRLGWKNFDFRVDLTCFLTFEAATISTTSTTTTTSMATTTTTTTTTSMATTPPMWRLQAENFNWKEKERKKNFCFFFFANFRRNP